MASLSTWSLYGLTHRREVRCLASAFIGEIAAILRVIETHDIVSTLELAAADANGAHALPSLQLPPFTIYTSDAAGLDKLPLPAPRQIAYFYTQMASFQNDLTAFLAEAHHGNGSGRTGEMRRMLSELEEALALGNDILRRLRPLVSRGQPMSLMRA
ncbi:hypothetical protein [Bosea psychrotolerans]|uniref:Uncharacterized protein n=1 Tax=Bosea psychrotolerans TaxID=1871628 RepID=A0A2S4MB75_9HYPH|nr:hypothetical protein [Bosea psychrotolerans]POR51992.1 hypothetical protein CYD53_106281 [Bosea psychrotolerans]